MPRRFTSASGFRATGEIDDGEIVMELPLATAASA